MPLDLISQIDCKPKDTVAVIVQSQCNTMLKHDQTPTAPTAEPCRTTGFQETEPQNHGTLVPKNFRTLVSQNIRTLEPHNCGNLRTTELSNLRPSEPQDLRKGTPEPKSALLDPFLGLLTYHGPPFVATIPSAWTVFGPASHFAL